MFWGPAGWLHNFLFHKFFNSNDHFLFEFCFFLFEHKTNFSCCFRLAFLLASFCFCSWRSVNSYFFLLVLHWLLNHRIELFCRNFSYFPIINFLVEFKKFPDNLKHLFLVDTSFDSTLQRKTSKFLSIKKVYCIVANSLTRTLNAIPNKIW
jgi:hypothetical protein